MLVLGNSRLSTFNFQLHISCAKSGQCTKCNCAGHSCSWFQQFSRVFCRTIGNNSTQLLIKCFSTLARSCILFLRDGDKTGRNIITETYGRPYLEMPPTAKYGNRNCKQSVNLTFNGTCQKNWLRGLVSCWKFLINCNSIFSILLLFSQ